MADDSVFIFFETSDHIAAQHAMYLIEGGRNVPIDKKWSYRSERSHHDPNVYHTHLRFKENDVAVVNQNGTMSHNTNLDKVPNRILQYIRDKGLTEGMLIEAADNPNMILVPPEVIRVAALHKRLFGHKRFMSFREFVGRWR